MPQVVSLGPFHYGEPQLAKYETIKVQYHQNLPYRARHPPFKMLVDEIVQQKINILQWYLYVQGNFPYKDKSLGRMMARDGLFLLQLFRYGSF